MQLIGTGSQRAGKTSRVGVGATFLTFASWKANATGADLSTVNFESYNAAAAESFDEGIMGPLACDVSFGGDFDAGTNPFDDPPGLYPRDDLAALSLYASRIDATLWAFPYVRLRSANNGAEASGKVTFDCSGKNQGPFTYPAGSV